MVFLNTYRFQAPILLICLNMKLKEDILLLIKSIIYRMFGTICTMLITFIFTGNIVISTSVGVVELLSKIILYYIYEKIWDFFTKDNKQ